MTDTNDNQSSAQQDQDLLRQLERASSGDRAVWNEILETHRPRLLRMVGMRLSADLRARVDASDVIQETYLEATERLSAYLEKPEMPFFLWLRFLTQQKMLGLYRHHVGAQRRDPRREVAICEGATPEATSEVLAAQLLGRLTSPTHAAARAELKRVVQDALNDMDALDRQVLVLRHFEQLTNGEVAEEMNLSEAAASKRYIRALVKLKEVLAWLNSASDR
ncbi:MAG: sigma-70 family RNA polymerase sigma factor [Planctomycetota bacterium]